MDVKKLLDKETINKMEYGTKIHEILEYSDFNNPNNKYVNNLLEKIDRNFINIYKEFEFIDGKKINVQLAKTDDNWVLGFPMILTGF